MHGGRLGLGRTVLWVPEARAAMEQGSRRLQTRCGHEEAALRPGQLRASGPTPASPAPPETLK